MPPSTPAHRELTRAPDEIPAVPRLIAELGLTGVLFTADALHCQKEGFAQAAETGNALLVRVKDNQPTELNGPGSRADAASAGR